MSSRVYYHLVHKDLSEWTYQILWKVKEYDDSPMTRFQEVLELISGEFCINLENQTHQQLDKGPLNTPVIKSVSPFQKIQRSRTF